MTQLRRRFTSQQKISVCRRHGISTTLYYDWQRRFLGEGLRGLKPRDMRSKNGIIEQR